MQMRQAETVVRMKKRNIYKRQSVNIKRKDLGIEGTILLKADIKKYDLKMW
jgi:hypothetical protein